MWKAAWRGLMERKLRLALTTLAIVLGVGFVTGTYVLTDSLERAFLDIFSRAASGYDVLIRPAPRFDEARRDQIPPEILETVRGVEGVEWAEGSVDATAVLIDEKGEPVGGTGPPTIASTYSPASPSLEPFEVRSGRMPLGVGEVALDVETATKHGWQPGSKLRAVLRGPVQEFELVGTVEIGGLTGLGGARLLVFELTAAQQLFERGETYDAIVASGVPGASADALSRGISAALSDSYQVISRESYVKEISDQIREGLDFLSRGLLSFAFVALFVGGFLIFNTFSILFAQRMREFAVLRALGAVRAQILEVVVAEALVIGVAASAAGIGAGVLIALGLQALLEAFGAELPSSGTPVLVRTVIVSLVVGIGVTLVSALFPALRATRVAPVAAMREGAVLPPGRRRVWARVLAGLLGAAGVALLVWGISGDPPNRLAVAGTGTASLFLGVALISPVLAGPLARLIGWPLDRTLLTGKLARRNAVRDPGRTAATAAALMVGVALVSFATIFASSLRASVFRVIGDRLRADFLVVGEGGFGWISNELAPGLEALPEVEVAMAARRDTALLEGDRTAVAAVDHRKIDDVFALDLEEGQISRLGEGIIVRGELASEQGWDLGTRLTVVFDKAGEVELPVVGIFANQILGSDVVISLERFADSFIEPRDRRVYVLLASGVEPSRGREVIGGVLAQHPNARLMDQADFRREQEEGLNRLLGLVNALLGLALLIALFGIVNTLALSVIERVREIGLLRAIGLTRRQVRAMVRWESVIIAVMGAVLGIGLGGFFAWLVSTSLDPVGFREFSIPVRSLIVYVPLAAAAGVIAAVLPARRAARVDVLGAIAVE